MENRRRVRKSVPWTSEFSVSFYRAVTRRQRQQQSADAMQNRNRIDSQVYVLRDGRLVGGGGGSRQHLSTNLAMATIWNTSKPMWADRGRGRRRFSWSRSVVVVAGGQSRWTACAVAHIMFTRLDSQKMLLLLLLLRLLLLLLLLLLLRLLLLPVVPSSSSSSSSALATHATRRWRPFLGAWSANRPRGCSHPIVHFMTIYMCNTYIATYFRSAGSRPLKTSISRPCPTRCSTVLYKPVNRPCVSQPRDYSARVFDIGSRRGR